jgi:hypothetical protein
MSAMEFTGHCPAPTWYSNAKFKTPMPESPAFNYSFNRTDGTLKFGVMVHQ